MINEQNYTQKDYQYKDADGRVYNVDYTIRFNGPGSGVQAVAEYSYRPSEEPTDRKLGEYFSKDPSYIKYTGYDFPRCDCEIHLRNAIASDIDNGNEQYDDGGLTKGDLGVKELFNDPYFEESYNAMMNSEEENYPYHNYDEDIYCPECGGADITTNELENYGDYHSYECHCEDCGHNWVEDEEFGVESCGIVSSNRSEDFHYKRSYDPIKGKPTVLGVDRFGNLVVTNGLNIRFDTHKPDGINLLFAEPITDETIDNAIWDFLLDDDSDNLKDLANRYDYNIANADEDELREIKEDIFDRVKSNIGEFSDQVYGYAGIECGYDWEIEDALNDLAKTDPNGYEMIRKYYLKDNIDIDDYEIWGWNITAIKKSLDFYVDSNFKIVVNKKLMKDVKGFSKPTEQNKRVEDGAIKDFEENGLSYEDRTKNFKY